MSGGDYEENRWPNRVICNPRKEQVKRLTAGDFPSLNPHVVKWLGSAGAQDRKPWWKRLRRATFTEVEASAISMTVDILLVDDNVIQAATRKAILTRSGRSVAVASDGERAIEYLDEPGSRPVGLVITDHLMPGMNGPEFVTRLRGRFAEMPVLVLSGMADAEDDYEGLDVIFRVKPLPPEELLALVRSLLDQPIGRTA
jgi:CheY-like chemotaxis protein